MHAPAQVQLTWLRITQCVVGLDWPTWRGRLRMGRNQRLRWLL